MNVFIAEATTHGNIRKLREDNGWIKHRPYIRLKPWLFFAADISIKPFQQFSQLNLLGSIY